jgi:hypothetical protein
MARRHTVYLTSHYVEGRGSLLATTLEAILGWQAAEVRAVIVSNVDAYRVSGFLAEWQQRFSSAGHSLQLEIATELENPLLLTWWHKRHLPTWVANASDHGDYFVYLEDDIALTRQNLEYFDRHLPQLRQRGLLPGFMRYEVLRGQTRLVDNGQPEPWLANRSREIEGTTYHANTNPYWAGFILDKRLGEEYLASRSASLEASKFVGWGIQERAAMGLTYEDVPLWMGTRLVVPVIDGKPSPDCLVWHCSNALSAANHPTFGRLTPGTVYYQESLAARLRRRTRELPVAAKELAKHVLRGQTTGIEARSRRGVEGGAALSQAPDSDAS